MTDSSNKIHPRFKLNGIFFTHEELKEVVYSLVKEGTEFEIKIGDFLMDWLADSDTITLSTSGATGDPVRLTVMKDQMENSARATGEFFGLKPGNKALLCLPVDYIAGKMMLVRAMVLGLELYYREPSSTPLKNMDSTYDFCAMAPLQLQNSLQDIEKIKTLIVGGTPLSERLKKAVQNKRTAIYETFGMTETLTHIALKRINGGRKDVNFKTLPNVLISKDDRACLIIDAPGITSKPVATNDVVELLSETEFKWLGRFDTIINSGGIKLIPEEIEKKLSTVINSRFFVTGIPDASLGEKLVLFVEGETDEDRLHLKINALPTLEKFERPKEIYSLPVFVETESGKIKRSETKALVQP